MSADTSANERVHEVAVAATGAVGVVDPAGGIVRVGEAVAPMGGVGIPVCAGVAVACPAGLTDH